MEKKILKPELIIYCILVVVFSFLMTEIAFKDEDKGYNSIYNLNKK